MVEVANWALSVTVSTKKLAEVLNTSCYSCLSLFGFLKTNGLFPTAFHFSFEHRKEMWDEFLPPPPLRHLSASLSDWGDNVTLPPWGDPEIIVGGDPNFDKEKAIFLFHNRF